MEDVDLSIIIPVYNVCKYLETCVNSIINQKISVKYEIILIDDGSNDGSSQICDDFAKKREFIKVIHKSNQGVSIARNVGLENAKGKYVFFVDSDDIVENGSIEKMINVLKETKAQLIQCNYRTIYENSDKKVETGINNDKIMRYTNNDEILNKFFKKDITISLWNKIFSKEIIKNIKFDENIQHYEDKLFIFQTLLNCNNFVHINIIGYNYLKRKNSASYEYFKYSYLQILNVDEEIKNIIEKERKSCLEKVLTNNFEGKLELVKMMIKSKAYLKYDKEYNKIINDIKKTSINIIFKARMKRKVEYIFIKFFEKIYIKILQRKNA